MGGERQRASSCRSGEGEMLEYIGEHGDELYYFFIPCLLFNLVYTWVSLYY